MARRCGWMAACCERRFERWGSGEGGDEVAQFFIGLGGVAEGLGDFGAHEFAEAFAEAVNGNFEGAGGDSEAAGGVSLGVGGDVGSEPGLENFKEVAFAFGSEFGFESEQGVPHNFEGPFAIEVGIGCRRGVVGELKGGTVARVVLRVGIERFGGDAAAAFQAVGALALFGEEMFEGAEEVGAEAAA